ncbi:MAG: ImmA/IrrE family metallo-endopeptidase [Candidatus Hydrogenedentota bacterium]
MDEEMREIMGSDEGLRFDFRFPKAAEGVERALGWGYGSLSFLGDAIWVSEDESGEEAPLWWTWLDLLEFLGKWWPWLTLEESYPIPLIPPPVYPAHLQREAERRWEDRPGRLTQPEEEAVHRFHCRHDLAMALKGIFVPSLIILRQGRQYLISDAAFARTVPRPYHEVVETLEEVGSLIADYVREGKHPRQQAALELWETRARRSREEGLVIRTGLSREELERLAVTQDPATFWEYNAEDSENDSELVAAARMTCALTHERQADILGHIRAAEKRAIPELDELTRRFREEFVERDRWHEQGYWAAAWLRGQLGQEVRESVDPETLLRAWGVAINEVHYPESKLEAIAAWGPKHGPVIFVNTAEGIRPSHSYGKRTTLAHEIAHLLIDRDRALPVAEVLGGFTPAHAEKRARAFAAEFLLPREAAVEVLRNAESLGTSMDKLQRDYEVSREVAAWQILNSKAFDQLRRDEHRELDSIVQ